MSGNKKQDATALSFERAVSVALIKNTSGFAVKARKGEKKPAPGWDPRTNAPARSAQMLEDIEFTDDNIGIHLHGDIVDVDVDGDDAHLYLIPALDAFLPTCSHVWGRTSRLRTHRAYMIKEMASFDPQDYPILTRLKRIKEVNCEVRGGPISRGEYSLLPSSIHPSGEPYSWASLGAAKSTISTASMRSIISGIRLAGAVAVLAPYWVEGMRQDMTMALAGFLHRAFSLSGAMAEDAFVVNKELSIKLLNVILDVSGDDNSDRYARRKAFEKTWAKAEKGLAVTGATTLMTLTGDNTLSKKLYTLLTDSPDIELLDDFTRRFVIWQGPGMIIDIDAAVNGSTKPMMSRQNFSNSYGHKFIEVGGKRKLVAEMVWHMEMTQRVQGLTFVPGADAIIVQRDAKLVNQWSGFEREPHIGPDITRFTDYLMEVVANNSQKQYDWVLQWLADIVQNPAEKPGTALVLVGLPGAGKSILGHQILGKIIGSDHYGATNAVANLTRGFNINLSRKILIQCDEALNSHQKNLASMLKSVITDPIQTVEPKGVDQYDLPMHARLLFTSNEVDNAIYISDFANDRRYTVIEVSKKRASAASAKYWSDFIGWLKEDGVLEAIHYFLTKVKIDKNWLMRSIDTDAKKAMYSKSWEPIDKFLIGMLQRGFPLSPDNYQDWHDAFTKKEEMSSEKWPEFINRAALERDMLQFCRSISSSREALSASNLGTFFKKNDLNLPGDPIRIKYKSFNMKTQKLVNTQQRVYPAPDPEKIYEYLTKKFGQTQELADMLDDENKTKDKIDGQIEENEF